MRIAELDIALDQLDAYKLILKEEIETSIRVEPGVLTLNAVSLKGHPEQIRLFEMYRDAASYESHLQSPHFKAYKAQTQRMVKGLRLIETEPILQARNRDEPAEATRTPQVCLLPYREYLSGNHDGAHRIRPT